MFPRSSIALVLLALLVSLTGCSNHYTYIHASPGADTRIEFGQKALRLPAHNAPDAVVRVVGRFTAERAAGEDFRTWLDRVGGPEAADDGRGDLDHFPSPDEYPEYYVDFGEPGPYVAEIGDSECAT